MFLEKESRWVLGSLQRSEKGIAEGKVDSILGKVGMILGKLPIQLWGWNRTMVILVIRIFSFVILGKQFDHII